MGVGYEACMMEVHHFLDTMKIDQCKEVPTRKIAAFSYFHDRAVDVGMLGEGESGVVTVQQYLDAAQNACAAPSSESPFHSIPKKRDSEDAHSAREAHDDKQEYHPCCCSVPRGVHPGPHWQCISTLHVGAAHVLCVIPLL